MRVGVVVYDGVSAAECEAFTSVLGLLDAATVVSVGAHGGSVDGPGGRQPVDMTFVEAADPHAPGPFDIVVVPGGIGCERAADDAALREFLIAAEQGARFVLASSTGTVVLASAGLLHGRSAATHWLAGDLLRRYGSDLDARRVVTTGNVITCVGEISAVEAAFALVERLEGPGAVERIRSTLLERGEPLLRTARWWHRVTDPVCVLLGAPTHDERAARARSRRVRHATADVAEPPLTPVSVMIELVDNDELARQLKRRSKRR